MLKLLVILLFVLGLFTTIEAAKGKPEAKAMKKGSKKQVVEEEEEHEEEEQDEEAEEAEEAEEEDE